MPLARTDQLELLDRLWESAPSGDLAGNLRDIRRANRYFGGARAALGALRPAMRQLQGVTSGPVSILDLATGAADIPCAIVESAERDGWHVRVVATDLQPEVLALARAVERPERIVVEQADARHLPYPDASFDIVTLSLALHHFTPRDARLVLGEMRRVGRALIVSDLERSRLGLAGAWLFSRVLTRNRLTRHDAPLSVRRAYTPREALAMASAAGWRATNVRRVAPFRFVLTGVGSGAP